MHFRKLCLALVICITALASWGVRANEPSPDLSLDRAVARVTPKIEAAAGFPFREPVPVEWADSDTIVAVMMEERDSDLRRAGREDDPMDRVRAQYIAIKESRAILGKYSVIRRRVYVVRDYFVSAIASIGGPDAHPQEVLETLVAHEMTHALDDQYFQLGEAEFRLPENESRLAYQALVEGHAVYVASEVCRSLGYPDYSRKMAELHDPGDPGDLLDAANYPRDVLMSFRYARGAEFVARLYETGGAPLIRRAFENPPGLVSHIFRPDQYTGRWPVPPELKSIVAPATALVPSDGLDSSELDANELIVRVGFSLLGNKRAEEVLRGYQTGFTQAFTVKDSEKKALITVFSFIDSDGAAGFWKGEEELMLAQWKEIEARKDSGFVQKRRLTPRIGDECVWAQAAYRSNKGEDVDDQQVFVRVGRLVFEVAVFNMKMTDESITELLNMLVESAGEGLSKVSFEIGAPATLSAA